MAGILNAQNKPIEAIGFYRQALFLADSLDLLEKQKEILNNLSMTYAKLNDFEKAFQFKEKHLNIIEKIYNSKTTQAIQDAREKYESELKDAHLKRKDAEIKQKKSENTLLLIALVGSITLIILIILIFQSRRKAVLLKHEIEKKKVASKSLIQGQEQEKKRIAEDLHDGTALMLSLLVQELSLHMDNYSPEIQAYLNTFLDKMDHEITNVRRISHELYPPMLKQSGIIMALQLFFKELQAAHPSTHFKFTYPISQEKERFDIDLETNLFRISQELAQNSIKHANATNIHLDISIEMDNIILTYTDDGLGFDQKSVSEGLGTHNIDSRATSIGGFLQIKTAKGQGFQLKLIVNNENN